MMKSAFELTDKLSSMTGLENMLESKISYVFDIKGCVIKMACSFVIMEN